MAAFDQLPDDVKAYLKQADQEGDVTSEAVLAAIGVTIGKLRDEASNVTPILASLDQTDARARDAVLKGYNRIRARICTDVPHLLSGQERMALCLSLCLPILHNHVESVIRVCPEKQVIDVDTGAIIASMADHETAGYGSILYFPRKTVGSFLLPLPVQHAVAKFNYSRPQHASVFIRRRTIMCKSLGKRPMTGTGKYLSLIGSHSGTSNAAVGQGRCRRYKRRPTRHHITNIAGR